MILNERSAAPANGLPEFRAYVWRARRPAWMLTALAAAEAQHGPPVPTCVCGNTLRLSNEGYATCGCGYKTGLRHQPEAAGTS